MDVHEWQESPDVREQAKAGRDPAFLLIQNRGGAASKAAAEVTKNRSV